MEIECLHNLGFKNIFYATEILFSILNGSYKINKLLSLVDDEKSKEVIESIIKYKLTQDSTILKNIAEGDQYFPSDIIKLHPNESFVDGGTFNVNFSSFSYSTPSRKSVPSRNAMISA